MMDYLSTIVKPFGLGPFFRAIFAVLQWTSCVWLLLFFHLSVFMLTVALSVVRTVALSVVLTVALSVVLTVALSVVLTVALSVVLTVALSVVLTVALSVVLTVAPSRGRYAERDAGGAAWRASVLRTRQALLCGRSDAGQDAALPLCSPQRGIQVRGQVMHAASIRIDLGC